MTRYRRKKLSRADSAAAAAAATMLGVGTAVVAFYVTRLFLSREPLTEGGEAGRALPPGDERLPATGGHDPGE